MNIGKQLVEAEIQADSTADLRNPLLKLILLLFPLGLILNQTFQRYWAGVELSLPGLIIISYFLHLAVVVNLRSEKLSRFVARALGYGFLTVLGVEAVTNGAFNTGFGAFAGRFEALYKGIPLIRKLGPDLWLLLIWVAAGYRAARNITSRDALWLGRRLLWRTAFLVYTVIIVTFAALHSAIPTRIRDAYAVAGSRYHLTAHPDVPDKRRRMTRRAAEAVRAGTSVLLFHIDVAGDQVRSLVRERGFFRIGFADPTPGRMGLADTIAIVLLLAGVASALAVS